MLRRDLRSGAMGAIKPKRARRTAVISGQMETNNFGLNSLFVSVPAWVGAKGRAGYLAFVNLTCSATRG
jgi:hypothetical protein